MTAQTSVTKDELAKLQQEDTTLQKYVNLKNAVRKGDYEIKYEKRRVFYIGLKAELMD